MKPKLLLRIALRERWELHPFFEEATQEVFARQEDLSKDRTRNKAALLEKGIRDAIQLILGWLTQLIEDRCTGREFALLHRPLSHSEDEIQLLRDARQLAFSGRRDDHYSYVKRVTDAIELRLRKYLLAAGSLFFGDDYCDHCPAGIRGYAYKNLDSRANYAVEINLFDGLTRSQYRSIFIDGNDCVARPGVAPTLPAPAGGPLGLVV